MSIFFIVLRPHSFCVNYLITIQIQSSIKLECCVHDCPNCSVFNLCGRIKLHPGEHLFFFMLFNFEFLKCADTNRIFTFLFLHSFFPQLILEKNKGFSKYCIDLSNIFWQELRGHYFWQELRGHYLTGSRSHISGRFKIFEQHRISYGKYC